jgi:hypothetical protein
MTPVIPTGAQLDGLLSALRDHAYSVEDLEREFAAGLSRTTAFWEITMHGSAPVVVEASTKNTYSTDAEAYRAAEELRDALVSSAAWEVKTHSSLGVHTAENSGDHDDIAAWFGAVRLRLYAREG